MEGANLKDLTYTSFGLIIAYLVPGSAALLGIYFLSSTGPLSSTVQNLVNWFSSERQEALLALGLVLAGFGFGVLLNGIRLSIVSLVECIAECCEKDWGLKAEHYKQLGKSTKVSDILALVEEEFRYHQFYAAMTIVLMGFCVGWDLRKGDIFNLVTLSCSVPAVFTVSAAIITYRFYTGIAKHMLRVGGVKLQAEVRRHAYYLYVNRGKIDGHALDDWLQAEAEVLEPEHTAAAASTGTTQTKKAGLAS